MPGGGSSIFTDPGGYEASLGGMLDLLVLRPRQFHARLTWVELPQLRLLRAQEAAARIAYLRLPPEQVFVTFPTQQDAFLICGGATLRFGDLMFHARGEHLHQRTTGATHWGAISLPPDSLAKFARALADRDLVPPDVGRVMRPQPADCRRLLRLHAEAIRIAERDLRQIAHREVARALDQDLMLALVSSLTRGAVRQDGEAGRSPGALSAALEALLAVHRDRMLRMREVCDAVGLSEPALRTDCAKLLGIGLKQYQRLRRLAHVDAELMHTHPATNADLLVQRYGFPDVHRFVTDYWKAFGEMPSIGARA
jgi:AraC-like DNA-binding protein